ncbi:MAG: hypothetical protein ACOC7S_00735 [Planctomycetota bacterium]
MNALEALQAELESRAVPVVVPTPERYRYNNCPYVAVQKDGNGYIVCLWNGGPTTNRAVPLAGGYGVRAGEPFRTKAEACAYLADWLLAADPEYSLPVTAGELQTEDLLLRAEAAHTGNTAVAAAIDGVAQAEAAGLSPLAMWLAGDVQIAHADDLSADEWRADTIRRHHGDPAFCESLDRAIAELQSADLYPWKEEDEHAE